MRRLIVVVAALTLAACSTWRPLDELADAAGLDGGPPDAGPVDAGATDSGE